MRPFRMTPIARGIVLLAVAVSSTALNAQSGTRNDSTQRVVAGNVVGDKTPVPSGGQLDMKEAVRMAVETHPSINAAMSMLAQQMSLIDAAKAGYYPQLGIEMRTTRETDKEHGVTPTLSVSQMLYDFGRVGSEVSYSEAGAQKQRALAMLQIDTLSYQTADALIGIHHYQEMELLAVEYVNAVDRVVGLAHARAESGLSAESDPVQAQTRYNAAETILLQSQTQRNQYCENLGILIGQPFNGRVTGMDPGLFGQARIDEPDDLERIPEVMSAEADRSMAEAQLKGAEAADKPTISLVASTGKTISGTNPTTGVDKGTHNYAGLNVNQSMYEGGRISAQKRAAAEALATARAQLSATQLSLLQQLRVLKVEIKGLIDRRGIMAERTRNISRTRELYEEQYKLGSRSVLDLLNAEQEYFQAVTEELVADHDIWRVLVQLIVTKGDAREAFGLNELVHEELQGGSAKLKMPGTRASMEPSEDVRVTRFEDGKAVVDGESRQPDAWVGPSTTSSAFEPGLPEEPDLLFEDFSSRESLPEKRSGTRAAPDEWFGAPLRQTAPLPPELTSPTSEAPPEYIDEADETEHRAEVAEATFVLTETTETISESFDEGVSPALDSEVSETFLEEEETTVLLPEDESQPVPTPAEWSRTEGAVIEDVWVASSPDADEPQDTASAEAQQPAAPVEERTPTLVAKAGTIDSNEAPSGTISETFVAKEFVTEDDPLGELITGTLMDGETPAEYPPTDAFGREVVLDTTIEISPEETMTVVPPEESQLEAEALEMARAWAAAWSASDAETYLSFYDRDFEVPGGRSRNAWERERKTRVGQRKGITVTLLDPVAAINNGGAMVWFRQNYRSSAYNATTAKRLELIRRDGQWRIIREMIEN